MADCFIKDPVRTAQ